MKKFLTKKITRMNLDKFIERESSDKLTLDLGCANSPYSRYFNNRVGFQANFKGGAVTKSLIFLFARIISFLPSLIKEEFGDIKKSSKEKNILASGYYLICKKI